MKRLILLLVICAAVTGFAAAGGLDFHLGAGYHSSYLDPGLPTSVESMPLGIGAYVGLGYGFGEKKMINIGAEFAPAWDVSFEPAVSNFSYQARGYLKFKPAKIFTLTAFGGWAGSSFTAPGFDSNFNANANAVVGARVTVAFLYAEYAAVLNSSVNSIARNEIGVGIAIFK